MHITNEKGAIDFLLFSYFGSDSADDEAMKSNASYRAYLDLARTVKYRYSASELDKMRKDGDKTEVEEFKKAKSELVNSICHYICKTIYDFPSNTDNFEKWHEHTCEHIRKEMNESGLLKEDFTFTYGQAQKWLNMTLKYLWLLDLLPDKVKEGALHVPIDGYIIEKLKELGIDKITGSGETYKYNNKEWSKIGKEDYQSLQAAIREAVKNSNAENSNKETPIQWEGKSWIEIAKGRKS